MDIKYKQQSASYNADLKDGVSIIICTYNGSKRLPETLSYLSHQKAQFSFEVIIVDNASTDNTYEIAKKLVQDYNVDTWQVVKEIEPGKTYALKTGLAFACYKYVVICDDDNWLEEDYIQLAYEIMESDSCIGALGGLGTPVCEVDPPEWFEQLKKYYATGEQYRRNGDVTKEKGWVFGAGMVINKKAWEVLKETGFNESLLCGKPSSFIAGEDVELCYIFKMLGFKIYYDNRLKFKHFIPKERLHWAYANKLLARSAKATSYLNIFEYFEKNTVGPAFKPEAIYNQLLKKDISSLMRERRKLIRLFVFGHKEGNADLLILGRNFIKFTFVIKEKRALLKQVRQVYTFYKKYHRYLTRTPVHIDGTC